MLYVTKWNCNNMKTRIYFLNNWNGHNSPERWNTEIKHRRPISGLIIGLHGFAHSFNSITYRIVIFGFGIGINITTK